MTIHGDVTIVNPFVQKLIGSVVRAALVALGGFLSAQAIANPEQISSFVEAAIPVIVGLVWSVWEKYTSRQKLVTTQAIAEVTEHQVEAKIKEGAAPSVTVAKNTVPPLMTEPYIGTGPKPAA
jgi:hypothetical protein